MKNNSKRITNQSFLRLMMSFKILFLTDIIRKVNFLVQPKFITFRIFLMIKLAFVIFFGSGFRYGFDK